jgi:hypothetical protein
MALKLIEPGLWRGTFIDFTLAPKIRGRKTDVFLVTTVGDNIPLGQIKWFSRWRKYCFFPYEATVFEVVCLSEIIFFITARMDDRK